MSILKSSDDRHMAIYDHFKNKFETEQWARYNQDIIGVAKEIERRDLGYPVSMSFSGIGADVSNGFIFFVCDDPDQQEELINLLLKLNDRLDQSARISVEIRTRTIPGELTIEGHDRFMAVMMRSPRLKGPHGMTRNWWTNLHTTLKELE